MILFLAKPLMILMQIKKIIEKYIHTDSTDNDVVLLSQASLNIPLNIPGVLPATKKVFDSNVYICETHRVTNSCEVSRLT